MANPTTYFGWVMPTATDLVTDLPADFNVFGQGVDTSLQDLLGGTTGQVLAKNSNTNMDFVWSAAGLSASIVDAKGDLIAATAADTVSRLAVGANGTVLTADSTEATGLKWSALSGAGLVFIAGGSASSTTSLTVSNCFSATYRNYRIIISNINGSGSEVETFLRMSSSGTPNTASTYTFQTFRLYGTGTLASTGNNGQSSGSYLFAITTTPANQGGQCVIDICSPFQALPTTFTTQSIVYNNAISAYMTNQGGGAHNTSSSFDGFNIVTATTTLSYDYKIYGYSNS